MFSESGLDHQPFAQSSSGHTEHTDTFRRKPKLWTRALVLEGWAASSFRESGRCVDLIDIYHDDSFFIPGCLFIQCLLASTYSCATLNLDIKHI